jgi:ribosomal protein S18 acetylase RimI-like enzyme
MRILNKLAEREIADVKGLNAICEIERVPNFDSSIFIDPTMPCFYLEYKDGILISFVSLFYVDDEVIEILGATHPSFRCQGYFSSLLREAMKVIPKGLPILYQIPSNYVDKEKLKLKGLYYHHGEEEIINRIVSKTANLLTPLNSENLEAVAKILAESFNRDFNYEIELLELMLTQENTIPLVFKKDNEVIGFIAISKTFDVKTSYLFAFCVDKKHRSKGYGQMMLNNLPYNPDGYVLRVNYENTRAREFYKRIGFVHLSSTEYYKKS